MDYFLAGCDDSLECCGHYVRLSVIDRIYHQTIPTRI